MPRSIQAPEELTKQQQGVLVAAMRNHGTFEVTTRAETCGKAVRTRHERFFDPNDRSVAKAYVQAVRELEQLLFVRESGRREGYELTNFGWLIGRKLLQAHKEAEQSPNVPENANPPTTPHI